MLIREKLIQQLNTLRYSGLSASERRRLSDYLTQVSRTLLAAQQAAMTGQKRKPLKESITFHGADTFFAD